MKIYCQKCGNATEYSFDKPKFCSGCGSSFTISASAIPKVVKSTPKFTQIESEEEISDEKVPDISKLEFDIEINSNKGAKLNSLLGTHNGQSPEETYRSAQGINKADALEAFKREAGFYPSRQSMNEEE